MKFPKGRTAFLVIHGIGEQAPFETLDAFARGLIRHLEGEGAKFDVSHEIARREQEGGAWTESFVRLKSGDDRIDVHEYYWAHLTELKIDAAGVLAWVRQTLEGTIRYYKENPELQEGGKGSGRPYWFRMRSIFLALRFVYPILRVLLFLLPHGWGPLGWIRGKIEALATPVLVGYIGDIAIYTTTDQKSPHYRIRQQILKSSQALLERLLEDAGVDRVIVAGHSLGSVIGFDTLNRLNLRANMEPKAAPILNKLQGLVTFGSPLDKIAFFFREQAGKEQYVRRQIMRNLHSFKVKPQPFEKEPRTVTSPLEAKLDRIPWVNYYDDKDPISGHLDYYRIDEGDNVKLNVAGSWGIAHVKYWEDEPFYRDVCTRYLGGHAPSA